MRGLRVRRPAAVRCLAATQRLRRQMAASPPAVSGPSSAYETTIFLALTFYALAGFCVWRIRRRRLA